MSDPNRARSHGASRSAERVGGSNRSTGDFKGNRAGFGDGAADNDCGTAGRDVHRRGKLQSFFAILVPTADKNRNSQLKPGPLALFFSGGTDTHCLTHPKRVPTPEDVADWWPNLG